MMRVMVVLDDVIDDLDCDGNGDYDCESHGCDDDVDELPLFSWWCCPMPVMVVMVMMCCVIIICMMIVMRLRKE